ncbi:MAG: hypothetical protein IJK53_08300 [Erysipelotrichaceae bacterium]|nr:hypothetical protein [Erysipelotrichaceae bacterium]
MSRKLNNVLKDIPDVFELRVDEKALAEDLKKVLIEYDFDKLTASEIAESIAKDFVLRFSENLFVRQDMSLAKEQLKKLFDLLSMDYLRIKKENEQIIEIMRDAACQH